MKMNRMMKWMILGCILVLVFFFIWPFLDIRSHSDWLFFGSIFLLVVCILPMLTMNKKNQDK
ncbi:membrane protein [Christiangramia flava JLT2011]|uniref:Uncharacterized protein n=1 Tax=Christiangramia flava JLT2011 TaxID=1229726 RepID=A0A1L7IAA7_9FLAO|nr:hypothetical protein GRFL_3450 [Christiangramia flava JLT2011]OSS39661.1 membrane protein [Christiangramia flava JLT2011]